MSYKYWSGGHTKHRLFYHLVFVPRYRKRVLRGKIATRLYSLFIEAAKVNWWWIEEVKIMPDHVHMLIQLHPNETVSSTVQKLKGGSSKILRKEFPEIQEFIWGDKFWGDDYFAETVGQVSAAKIKKFIKEQQESMPQ